MTEGCNERNFKRAFKQLLSKHVIGVASIGKFEASLQSIQNIPAAAGMFSSRRQLERNKEQAQRQAAIPVDGPRPSTPTVSDAIVRLLGNDGADGL